MRETSAKADRARGALVGLAVGDALGAPVEFDAPEAIAWRRAELLTLPGGGVWGPGEFTDDTQMALVLARHLAGGGGKLDQQVLAEDFAAWAAHQGTLDVGIQTSAVLGAVSSGRTWSEAVTLLDPDAAGNGSLMRTAPVALAGTDLDSVQELARLQSEVTHPNRWCVDACAVFSATVRITMESGELRTIDEMARGAEQPEIRDAVLAAAHAGSPTMSGFVLHTLTSALWAVYGADSFEAAVWRAVSLGQDADTVGAVAGALAGARWGRSAIPDSLAGAIGTRHELFAGDYPDTLERLAVGLLRTADADSP